MLMTVLKGEGGRSHERSFNPIRLEGRFVQVIKGLLQPAPVTEDQVGFSAPL